MIFYSLCLALSHLHISRQRQRQCARTGLMVSVHTQALDNESAYHLVRREIHKCSDQATFFF